MPKEDGGWNTHGLTQKMVDAYYMADGSNCRGMNAMYAGVPGYEERTDSRTRETEFTTVEDLKIINILSYEDCMKSESLMISKSQGWEFLYNM
ncbi:RagB/SusD family nutrient uptake outer membrane protein [Bacteroides thetaiotaomicron]|nr:RagB/SusD family nutrient uptake outer membrane protein [Bacteroides thetaiotaomicron]